MAKHLRNGYETDPRADRAQPGAGVRRAGRPRGRSASPSCPASAKSLFPTFKEQDFLSHMLTKPGTSLPEEQRIVMESSQELRGDPGRPGLRLPHRPGDARGGDVRRRLRRELDQHRSESRLRRDAGADRGDRPPVPRACSPTSRPTSPSGSARCSPARANRSSSACSERSWRSCARRRKRSSA